MVTATTFTRSARQIVIWTRLPGADGSTIFGMGQLALFSRAQLAGMRDRTRSRRWCPQREQFRREHQERRDRGKFRLHTRRQAEQRAHHEGYWAPGASGSGAVLPAPPVCPRPRPVPAPRPAAPLAPATPGPAAPQPTTSFAAPAAQPAAPPTPATPEPTVPQPTAPHAQATSQPAPPPDPAAAQPTARLTPAAPQPRAPLTRAAPKHHGRPRFAASRFCLITDRSRLAISRLDLDANHSRFTTGRFHVTANHSRPAPGDFHCDVDRAHLITNSPRFTGGHFSHLPATVTAQPAHLRSLLPGLLLRASSGSGAHFVKRLDRFAGTSPCRSLRLRVLVGFGRSPLVRGSAGNGQAGSGRKSHNVPSKGNAAAPMSRVKSCLRLCRRPVPADHRRLRALLTKEAISTGRPAPGHRRVVHRPPTSRRHSGRQLRAGRAEDHHLTTHDGREEHNGAGVHLFDLDGGEVRKELPDGVTQPDNDSSSDAQHTIRAGGPFKRTKPPSAGGVRRDLLRCRAFSLA